jgi:hypothetical protein
MWTERQTSSGWSNEAQKVSGMQNTGSNLAARITHASGTARKNLTRINSELAELRGEVWRGETKVIISSSDQVFVKVISRKYSVSLQGSKLYYEKCKTDKQSFFFLS